MQPTYYALFILIQRSLQLAFMSPELIIFIWDSPKFSVMSSRLININSYKYPCMIMYSNINLSSYKSEAVYCMESGKFHHKSFCKSVQDRRQHTSKQSCTVYTETVIVFHYLPCISEILINLFLFRCLNCPACARIFQLSSSIFFFFSVFPTLCLHIDSQMKMKDRNF